MVGHIVPTMIMAFTMGGRLGEPNPENLSDMISVAGLYLSKAIGELLF